ncbi:MAG: hypothetical protein ACYCW6_03865 [Candidatus Xenobia bacterium]
MRRLFVLAFALLALTLGAQAEIVSGLAPGSPTPAFHPQHVAGPDAGSTICPV